MCVCVCVCVCVLSPYTGFDMSDERGGDGDGGMERALADSRLREGKEEDTR